MLAEGQMRRFYQVVVACGLLLLLGACAKTTALEPQDQTLDTRLSRLYFFRQAESPTVGGGFAAADINVDGKLIGSLAPGTTVYIIADRPEGPHKITVYRSGDATGFDADVPIEASTSYYFEIGPAVEATIDQAKLNSMGLKGRPLPGRFAASTPFMFYSLDAVAGAGVITKLKSEQSLRLVPPSCESSPPPQAPGSFPDC
jgi:hypothetical protein